MVNSTIPPTPLQTKFYHKSIGRDLHGRSRPKSGVHSFWQKLKSTSHFKKMKRALVPRWLVNLCSFLDWRLFFHNLALFAWRLYCQVQVFFVSALNLQSYCAFLHALLLKMRNPHLFEVLIFPSRLERASVLIAVPKRTRYCGCRLSPIIAHNGPIIARGVA